MSLWKSARGWWLLVVGVAVLVSAPVGAYGQPKQAPASALEEAKRLNGVVLRLYGEGQVEAAVPWAERSLSIVEKVLGPEHLAVAASLNTLALLYATKEDYAKAEPLYQRSLTIAEKVLGPEHPDVATSLNNLALLYKTKGDYAKAAPLYQRSLAIVEKVLGPEHPDAATSLNNLAGLYATKGDYAKAAPLYQRSLAIREKVLGPEHPDVAASLNNLAWLYATKLDYANAEPLYQRALAIWEKALGPEHPNVATSLNNLALLYDTKGVYAKAEPLYQRALAIREKVLGPEHPDVATSLNNLASLYNTTGDYAKAEPLYQRALVINEKVLGPEHPDVATSLNNLAGLYATKGNYAKSEPLYQRALAIFEKVLGPEHPDVATSLNNFALLYDTKGDYAKAEPLYQRALAIFEKVLGPEHPDVATSLNNLASLYVAKGDYAKAEPLFQRALAINEKVLGPEHPDVATSLSNLASLHDKKGDYAKTEPLGQRALAIREKVLGPEHPDVAQSLNNLAGLYATKGDYAKAEPLYQRALTIREKALGPEHPDVAGSLSNLALLHYTKGGYAKAEPLYQRALAIGEKMLGPEHPNVAQSLNNLAGLYATKGDYAKAEPLYQRALAIREKVLGPEHPDVAGALNNLAWLYLASGDIAKAVQKHRRANRIEDRNAAILLTTGSDEQKRVYMATLRGTTDAAISLHVQSAPSDPDAKRLAFGTILRRKGRVLDAMTDSFAALRRGVAPADRARFDLLRAISAQYSALTFRGPGKMPLDVYRVTLAGLDAKREELESQISRRSVELQVELRPIAVEQVQAALPEGAALVELFRYEPFNPKAGNPNEYWGQARYVAYVLRRQGEVVWADLGEAAVIEAAVEKLLPALRRAAADPEPAARALDALVMQPIRRLLGETRWVFLSPDGALNLVPFAALRDEGGHYLVEHYAFTYLTSGRDLLRFGVPSASQQRPVILAAPDFDSAAGSKRTAPRASERSAEMGSRSYGPLMFAAEEGQAVRRHVPEAELLMGSKATESAVKALRGPTLLHIATHGFFLSDQPELHPPSVGELRGGLFELRGDMRPRVYSENPLLRSGLVFAGANRGQSGNDDGVLTALEASQLDLTGTKLVVLSACETGVGKVLSGDGVYGLRRALVMAGAETQVMSLWQVNDAATREQMESYYEALLRGEGRSEAMRQVQLAMAQSAERGHPYFWASFIVSGSPASLEGNAVAPDFARVGPGLRGCGCEVAGGSSEHAAMGGMAVAALGLMGLRRRRAR